MQTTCFDDFDAFAESIADIDATMILQNMKRRRWNVGQVFLTNAHVQLGRLGSGNICEGQSWSHGHMLYLPLTDECDYLANGVAVSKDSFMVLPPGCEFCIATKSEHDWCSVFIPTERFASDFEDRSSWTANENGKWAWVSEPDSRTARRLRDLVRQTFTAAKHSRFESSAAAAQLEIELTSTAADVYRQDLPHHREPRYPRKEIIRRCRQLLEKHEGEVIHVNELVIAADVSERTLRTAFNEYYGVGPRRFLQIRQLQQIHRALKTSDADACSVSQVLFDHGVWECGRFASRYRKHFGELPSETLRKRT